MGLALLSGCATYSEKLVEVRRDVDLGAYPGAIDRVNDILGVSSAEKPPAKWKGDRSLAVLERGVLLQAQNEFALSARDLSGGETELELLDLKTDTVGQIGKYIYSDSVQDYEASATERLALNALNMINYLALGDLSGASVEARRFTNMREYLSSIHLKNTGTFGSYLAGFVFERLGEGDRALRYYEEALERGGLDSLALPAARLARLNPYRGPRLNALLAESSGGANDGEDAPTEILVVVGLGRVPYKVPERIPIGAAVGIAGSWITGNPAILERSLLKVVVYPELVNSGGTQGLANVEIDGKPARVELLSHLGADIRKEYALIKPRIIGAAISRMIARAAAAEGARVAGREAGGDLGQIIGLLAALFTEGTLVALDKPDTRSWTLLPERISVARIPVRPGEHRVEVRLPGIAESRSVTVDVEKGGFGFVVVTEPR